MKKLLPVVLTAFIGLPSAFAAELVTQIPMEGDAFKRFKDNISNKNLNFYGKHAVENLPGAVGKALRLDGYSTYVEGAVNEFTPAGASSFAVWVAPETYPIVEHDVHTNEKITIAGTINDTDKSGWAFSIGKYGKYSFDCYINGWKTTIEASEPLPCYEWSYLVAVNEPNGKITLYRNGDKVAEANSSAPLGNGKALLTIGKTASAVMGDYSPKVFNGLIDEVCVYNGALSANELSATPQNDADLTIPASRFEKDLLRPKFHGMPGANWTNETHGMTYSDGKYHVFFQKNANGPFMSRLHWGHISSENLYDWTEEKIAIAPGDSYDLKGCWSGAVFSDDDITGGSPVAIYTGVDYKEARIVMATPTDESLLDWEKNGVIIDGKPSGLSDDFRDPYFFRAGNNAYIIVGSAKGGIGTTTLHKYNKATKRWSNDGKLFFSGTSEAEHGTFWEMPNVTQMNNGKWLFTTTPQNTSAGVHTICWVGDINDDGTFTPISDKYFELELVNGQGYGLLSPTIYQKDGKTILMGIVPDKLSTAENCNMGWAHLYSLPRELSLDENNNLVQQPYSGLANLRDGDNSFSASSFSLDGTKTIDGVKGRQFEVKGVFTVGNSPFGFNVFKNSSSQVSVAYNPAENRLEVNVKGNRKVNDANSFGGKYYAKLPETPAKGSDFTLDVWGDGSILDIFVNNKYATSIRVFLTDNDAENIEAYSTDGATNVKSLQAWVLKSNASGSGSGDAGIDEIFSSDSDPEFVNVYSVNGMIIRRNVHTSEALNGLPRGIYIVNGKKIAL